jgi:hypothetical protein
MPATAEDEETVGYDKFELGAVLIEDGFQVYEILKTTQDMIEKLKPVLPSDKVPTINFYLRQIQSFCDVMADLGLMGVMEDVLEMYKVKPRNKNKSKPAQSEIFKPNEKIKIQVEKPAPKQKVLDPNKKYNHFTKFDQGYYDPFSGTSPGNDPDEDEDADLEGEGEGDPDDMIIYFDIKTGRVGKISRGLCQAQQVIVMVNDKGEEKLDGEIHDSAEKEKLIWDLKKAVKGSTRPSNGEKPKLSSQSSGSGKNFGASSPRPKPGISADKQSSKRSVESPQVSPKSPSPMGNKRGVSKRSAESPQVNPRHNKSNPPSPTGNKRVIRTSAESPPVSPRQNKSGPPSPTGNKPVIRRSTESPPSPTKQKFQPVPSPRGNKRSAFPEFKKAQSQKIPNRPSPPPGTMKKMKSERPSNSAAATKPSTRSSITNEKPSASGWNLPGKLAAKRAGKKNSPFDRSKELENLKALKIFELKTKCKDFNISTGAMVEKQDFYNAILNHMEKKQ